MKVAILSESAADEAAMRILADGVLGTRTVSPLGPAFRMRGRGWPTVLKIIPAVVQHLHYASDADGLIVVVDSDLSPIHTQSHKESERAEMGCRLCQVAEAVALTKSRLRPVPGRSPLRVAVGLAVPQIEAWYLVGIDPHVNEATWTSGQQLGVFIVQRETLKRKAYGTDRPSLEMETDMARQHAERIVREGHLPHLESLFPGGFGALASDLRGWLQANG
jgi:hypothetical protein